MNIAIFGSTGAIGGALVQYFSTAYPDATIHAISRSATTIVADNIVSYQINLSDELEIENLAQTIITTNGKLDYVVVATGLLHNDDIMPEKSMLQITAADLQYVYEVNTIIPALIAKYFLPQMTKSPRAVFALLSDRVGSISDNNRGGWYAYRSAKCALNMIIKSLAIEFKRSHPRGAVIGLYPGVVDSYLSKPFQETIPKSEIQQPDDVAEKIVKLLETLPDNSNGKCLTVTGDFVIP